MPEFILIMAVLAALGAYLVGALFFEGGQGAIGKAQNTATDKIAND